MLGTARRVWFYTPPGYDASQDWYPVLYVLDGGVLESDPTRYR